MARLWAAPVLSPTLHNSDKNALFDKDTAWLILNLQVSGFDFFYCTHLKEGPAQIPSPRAPHPSRDGSALNMSDEHKVKDVPSKCWGMQDIT